MGKHANSVAWREYEAKQDRELDAHLDDESPLSEFEKAAEWDDERWNRLDDINATFDQVFRAMR
jgi:hypothetical protein